MKKNICNHCNAIVIIILISFLLIGCKKEEEVPMIISNSNILESFSIEELPINDRRAYDLELAVEKGINEKKDIFSHEYLTLQEVYRKAFGQFIIEKLDLKKYEQELLESDMRFIPADKGKQSFYQKWDNMDMKYIFLRNNIPIERLNENDLEILKKEAADNRVEPSSEVMEMIERTYQDIISLWMIEKESDRKVETFYEQAISPVFVTMDSLVLEIQTCSEFDENGNYVSKEHEHEKDDYLGKLAERMERELDGLMGDTPIRIILMF